MADIAYRPRSELYPEIEPYNTGTLRLDGVHTMYWEQSGNPDGAPVLMIACAAALLHVFYLYYLGVQQLLGGGAAGGLGLL